MCQVWAEYTVSQQPFVKAIADLREQDSGKEKERRRRQKRKNNADGTQSD